MHIATCFDSKESSSGYSVNHNIDTSSDSAHFGIPKCALSLDVSTGLFISPSGISELDCATTKTDTAERSISIGRESLQVFLY